MKLRFSRISLSAALVLAAGTELATAALDFSSLRNPVWISPDNLRDPSVLKVADGYRLFYSRLHGTNWSAPASWTIAVAFTKDFLHFEDDRDVSPKGHASPGDVVRWQGRFLLPYQTYPAAPTHLCFSESLDLREWSAATRCTASSSAARMSPMPQGKSYGQISSAMPSRRTPSWNGEEILTTNRPLLGVSSRAPDGVENVMVFRTGDHWTMIYSEGLADQHLAQSTSPNLRDWKLEGPIELPRQSWMARKYGAPFVWREPDRWVMILMGENAARRTTFGLLTSFDGRHWIPLPERTDTKVP